MSQQTAAKERCSGPRPCSHSYVSCRSSLASYVGSGKAHCVVTLCLCLLAASDRLTVHSTVLCSCFLPTAHRAYTAYTLRSRALLERKSRLPERKMVSTLTSCDVNHVPKSTRLSLRFSALGSKVMRIIIARRRESLGYTRLSRVHGAKKLTHGRIGRPVCAAI